MKGIITIIGKDKTGIIAGISTLLSNCSINILDINQTVMREYFTMIMLVDLDKMNIGFADLQQHLNKKGDELCMNIRIQREDIFDKMYEI
ncbi:MULTISPECIES: ACT domain-containing protein [unclassified Sedimentibacter]|uniref:ACT domain-containing protein n=1 Tax=unclassified Sedimentibacter TaxID=2649220 RepID=UPI0027E1087D|nr:ACT domain-containing protein [Sedimentibacter sp. MB35-C1]WMJ76375.1 ACT domain-containing protein [Sedimentibacter sp. MB35-C1]